MDRYPGLERRHDAAFHSLISRRARVVLTPLPFAGSTPLVRLFARGEAVDDLFTDGAQHGRSTPTIHDPTAWPTALRWHAVDATVRTEAGESGEWLRLTTTREPGARLWEAWQSVILLGGADAAARFGDAEWFPRDVLTVEELLAAFRSFVHALDSELLFADPAWTPQTLLVESMPTFTHRIDAADLDQAVALLADRLGVATDGVAPDPILLPYVPEVYDAATAALVNRCYRPDREAYGYAALDETDAELPAQWRHSAEILLPALAQLAEANALRERAEHARVDAEAERDLERQRVAQLREHLDEQWDSHHDDRAALVALTARLDDTEQELAGARRTIIDRTKGGGAERTRERAKTLARRVRRRVAAAKEGGR